MEYTLERLKIEQIVVTERYARDTSQWDKLRSFWHPDNSQTSLKISWFSGTIDKYVTDIRTTSGLHPQWKNKGKHSKGLFSKHIIAPVDVTSTSYLVPFSLFPILLQVALLIQVHGDRALCEAHGELQSRPTLHYETYDFCSTATFLIKLVRVGAHWKIISFESIYNTDNIVPLFEDHQMSRYPTLTCPRESYRHLHYVVEKTQGYKLDGNLPGWDRPKEALMLLEQARKWTLQNGK